MCSCDLNERMTHIMSLKYNVDPQIVAEQMVVSSVSFVHSDMCLKQNTNDSKQNSS